MVIGIPKEIMEGERRVSATPETVSRMVGDSLRVLVEKAAGEGSYYSDGDYRRRARRSWKTRRRYMKKPM